jgi:hypothetical protein
METISIRRIVRHWSRYLFLEGAFVGVVAGVMVEALWTFPSGATNARRFLVLFGQAIYFWHLTIGGGFILNLPPEPLTEEDREVVVAAVVVCIAAAAMAVGAAFATGLWAYLGAALSAVVVAVGIAWQRHADILRFALSLVWFVMMTWALWIIGPIASIYIGFCALIVYYCYKRLRLSTR